MPESGGESDGTTEKGKRVAGPTRFPTLTQNRMSVPSEKIVPVRPAT
jgi:hypothetical protein